MRRLSFASASRLPAIYPSREYVDEGGLLSYGANVADISRRAAHYVDRIVKGAKPADLPVEQVTSVELVVNLTTARPLASRSRRHCCSARIGSWSEAMSGDVIRGGNRRTTASSRRPSAAADTGLYGEDRVLR